MHNNFNRDDFKEVKKLLNTKNPVLTQSKKLKNLKKNGPNG